MELRVEAGAITLVWTESGDHHSVNVLAGRPGIGREKIVSPAMLPHFHLLVSAYAQVGARFSGAEQNEASLAVFGKICARIRLVYFALALQTAGAGQAISL